MTGVTGCPTAPRCGQATARSPGPGCGAAGRLSHTVCNSWHKPATHGLEVLQQRAAERVRRPAGRAGRLEGPADRLGAVHRARYAGRGEG